MEESIYPFRPRKPANDRVVGARVIYLRCLSKGIESKHNSKGSKKDEFLELVCDTCEKTFQVKSSPKISGSSEINQRYSVNVGAVWGQCQQVGSRND